MFEQAAAQLVGAIIPWIILIGVVSLLVTVFKTSFWPKILGRMGESSVNSALHRNLDKRSYHSIADVMLPTSDGTTQIDHIVVSRYGIFVIETKNYTGWIYGGERDAKWTQVIYKRKQRFQNPLRQNYKHIKTLSELTGIPMEYFKSVIVFVGDSTFKTKMPENVISGRKLTSHIKSYTTAFIQDEQVSEIVSTIRARAGTVTDEQKKSHVKNLRRSKAPVAQDSNSPACPRCSAAMVLRTSRKDNSHFWGCPGFPKCRGTRNAA